VTLHGKIETQRCGRCCRVLLDRFKAKHQHRVLAGSGGQAADFKTSGVIGGGRDLAICTAFSGDGGTWDGLPPGPHNAGLHIGCGSSRKNQQNQTSSTQHEFRSS
jgi:hypothetical protein